jgi:DNA-directed RNA polymerase subunit RPC12/RpoP
MAETETTTEHTDVAPAAPADTSPAAIRPTIHPKGSERTAVDLSVKGPSPLTMNVERADVPLRSGGVVALDNTGGTHVRGSAASMRQEAKRLEKAAAEQERKERETSEEEARFQVRVKSAEQRAMAELIAEMRAQVKRCPGTVTGVACPNCSGKENGAIMRRVSVERKAGQPNISFVTVGSPVFFMRKQGELLTCPRCSHVTYAF